jgi:AICAR transformylase/IMP cyclohydrolase PurH
MNELAIRRALISVSDKSGLVEFARFLKERGVEILSTGGSAKAMSDAGIAVTEVSTHTGFPEIMDGRVKTLHPLIHGGILARRDSEAHLAAATEHGIGLIDLVVVNLYPFEATLASGADEARLVENIDVGGPAMIRAAAKNFDFVAVVTSPADYKAVQEEMALKESALSRATRRRLSASAFARTSAYDAAIAGWMNKEAPLASRLILAGELKQSLRYGENPHQQAAFYLSGEARPGVATARQIQGKELSYNNLNDTDAAYELVAEFKPARGRHRQACQSLRRGDCRRSRDRLSPGARLRSGQRLRRHRRGQHAARCANGGTDRRAFRRGGDRAGLCARRRSTCWHRRRICGCSRRGRCPIPPHRASRSRHSLAGFWRKAATMGGITRENLT